MAVSVLLRIGSGPLKEHRGMNTRVKWDLMSLRLLISIIRQCDDAGKMLGGAS